MNTTCNMSTELQNNNLYVIVVKFYFLIAGASVVTNVTFIILLFQIQILEDVIRVLLFNIAIASLLASVSAIVVQVYQLYLLSLATECAMQVNIKVINKTQS